MRQGRQWDLAGHLCEMEAKSQAVPCLPPHSTGSQQDARREQEETVKVYRPNDREVGPPGAFCL